MQSDLSPGAVSGEGSLTSRAPPGVPVAQSRARTAEGDGLSVSGKTHHTPESLPPKVSLPGSWEWGRPSGEASTSPPARAHLGG